MLEEFNQHKKWVEAFSPTSKQDAGAVATALLCEIIWKWRIPAWISDNNGTPFISAALKQAGEYLGIDSRHGAYHRGSRCAVEREQHPNKQTDKMCTEIGLTWTKAFPIVLRQTRVRVRPKYCFSPLEILLGRPFSVGIGPSERQLPTTDRCEVKMLRYWANLGSTLTDIHT